MLFMAWILSNGLFANIARVMAVASFAYAGGYIHGWKSTAEADRLKVAAAELRYVNDSIQILQALAEAVNDLAKADADADEKNDSVIEALNDEKGPVVPNCVGSGVLSGLRKLK